MTAALLAALAGCSFGALTVAARWGVHRGGDPIVGAFVTAAVAAVVSASLAAPSFADVSARNVLPFLAAGLIAPGASQILLTLAAVHAGPARAAILLGTAPLISSVAAFSLLGEPFRPALVLGTVLIVLGAAALARDRSRPGGFRARGAAFALMCAGLFASRDNLLRWLAGERHLPSQLAAAALLVAAAVLLLAYLSVASPARLRRELAPSALAFAPAGIALAGGYCALLAALSRGRVSVVSPLNATGSLWAVLLAVLVFRRRESVGPRTFAAAALVVAGGGLVGAFH